MAECPHAAAPDTVLQCVDLCKCYNGVVQASDHVNFTLRRGEVHAFLGENGAGKSTLMKMLYGIEQPDEGRLYLSGQPVTLKSPADAIAHGIGMVHQELMLIPHLTVAENITLGQEIKTRGGRLKKQEASRSIRELAASYGLEVDPDALVDKLTIGQRQRVEIVKLLYRKADILIFDEPTALLTPQESDALFDVLRRLRDLGKSTIFITHKLREVYQIADRMTVIRQGRIIGTTTPQETGMAELTQMMVGKTVPTGRRQPHPIGEEVLRVQDLSVRSRAGTALQDITFSIRAGEVLGVAGIEGNGQTPLAQALLIVQGADIVTGLLCAVTGKSRKTESGKVSSGTLLMGVMKKGLEWLVVGVCVSVGNGLGMTSVCGAAMTYMIATELVSLIENLEIFGLNVPLLGKLLDVAQGEKKE